ncbi:MAG: hypothetical protein WDM86_07785 [Rhizomicrobium sp.]
MRLAVAALAAFVVVPAHGADDAGLARMAACQDSWLDWQKSNPAKLKAFGDRLRAGFERGDNDPFVVPKAEVSVDGLRIAQAFPESVGMGVGFSLLVDAKFDTAKRALERRVGKPLAHCEASDGMRSCEMPIAEQRTLTVMAEDDPKTTQTLIGCYYFYEK